MRVHNGVKVEKGQVCKLNKSLYGFKQSAQFWFERFDQVLGEHEELFPPICFRKIEGI